MTTLSAAALPQRAARAAADRAIAFWLIGCAAMIFLMVMIGGITRLKSGLSITEWQPIAGVLPPVSAAQWRGAFAAYQAIPQFHAIHADMTLAQFKGIYFWEYSHRLWGRLIGFVFLLPFLYFLIRGRIDRKLWPKLALIFVLGALQGALGWYMVESGIEHRIEVNQYRLAAHLFAAIVIYGAILWVAFDLLWPRAGRDRHPARFVTWGLNLVLLLVAATLIAGGRAGLRGGSIYNSFPLMGDRFMPGEYASCRRFGGTGSKSRIGPVRPVSWPRRRGSSSCCCGHAAAVRRQARVGVGSTCWRRWRRSGRTRHCYLAHGGRASDRGDASGRRGAAGHGSALRTPSRRWLNLE